MAYTAVGSFATSRVSGGTTLAVTPATVGNLLVVTIHYASNAFTASSLSGGGVTTWTKAKNNSLASPVDGVEIWYGTITATGAQTITVTWSASASGIYTRISAQEFNSGLTGGSWGLDSTAPAALTAASGATSIPSPTITPSAAGLLYVGTSYDSPGTPSAGSTAGYTYQIPGQGAVILWNPACTSAAQAPTTPATSTGYNSIGVMFKYTGGTAPVTTSTVLNMRQAVQRAAVR